MTTLEIHDLKEGFLAFDLRDLLDLLSPRSLQASWTISPVTNDKWDHEYFEATGHGGEELERLSNSDEEIPGTILVDLANNTRQVIWGEFTGILLGEADETWVKICAIDSTFFEITTRDNAVLELVRSSFEDVRECSNVPYG